MLHTSLFTDFYHMSQAMKIFMLFIIELLKELRKQFLDPDQNIIPDLDPNHLTL